MSVKIYKVNKLRQNQISIICILIKIKNRSKISLQKKIRNAIKLIIIIIITIRVKNYKKTYILIFQQLNKNNKNQ